MHPSPAADSPWIHYVECSRTCRHLERRTCCCEGDVHVPARASPDEECYGGAAGVSTALFVSKGVGRSSDIVCCICFVVSAMVSVVAAVALAMALPVGKRLCCRSRPCGASVLQPVKDDSLDIPA